MEELILHAHGGDTGGLGRPVLDFSASFNPRGVPPCAVEAGRAAIGDDAQYPDPYCRRLRRAVAGYCGVAEEMVLCGAGAGDLIDRLVRSAAPKRALLPVPTFSEYEKALAEAGCQLKLHVMREQNQFRLDGQILSEITPETDLLFLCDPNNPSGALLDGGLLEDILARCRETGTLLAVDQSFLELADTDIGRLTGRLDGGGLILIRALTKSFGLAGLRLGYCLSGEQSLLRGMARLGQPWPVSAPAQAAGEAALTQAPGWPRISIPLIRRERTRIARALEKAGAEVCPSEVNFLLFRWKDNTLKNKMLSQGILIRQCGDFRGLDDCYFRVAVRRAEANERFLYALAQICGG